MAADYPNAGRAGSLRYTGPIVTPYLSVVVPAFNEAGAIGPFIERMRAELPARVPSWEIIVVDDGSRDRTRAIAEEAAQGDERVRVLAIPHAGKGAAVRHGLLAARGDWRFIADADLSMPPSDLQRFLDIAAADRTPVIIGSREAPGSRRVGEPWRRHAIGRCFNWLVRLVALSGIQDTQCGFKLLRADAVGAIVPALTLNGFAFDVEMLVLARLRGFAIREVGIEWHARPKGRVTIGRGAAAFKDVVALRWRILRGRHPAVAAAPLQAHEHVWGISAGAWIVFAGLILAAAIGYDLMRMPVQVYDAVGEILGASHSPSAFASFTNALHENAYLRPFRIAQIKLLFDVSGGHYWLAYRTFHAALIAALFVLFVRALRVRTRVDAGAALVALTVLVGLQTFRGTVQEAFPINHFLEIAVFSLVMLNLAQSEGGVLVEAAAALTFAAAALTLESGLLTWVVAAAAWIVGMRGISTRGLVALTILLGVYGYARFVNLSVGMPALAERSSGYLLQVLDPPELERRFGAHRTWWHSYNVLASFGSVLFSEPQSGVLVATRGWLRGTLLPRNVLQVVSSVLTTAWIALAATRLLKPGGTLSRGGQLLFVSGAVIAANAVLSFSYTKDEIMSTAGVFYAIASYAAAVQLLGRPHRRAIGAAAVGLLLISSPLWAIRAMGIHHVLAWEAFKQRNDWALLPSLWQPEGRWPTDAHDRAILTGLRTEALSLRVPNPYFDPRWEDELWGD